MVSVNKGNWDMSDDDTGKYNFNRKWIVESLRVLKDGGTIWVSGTLHNIYDIGYIVNSLDGLKILNNITWMKTNPPPNLSTRYFTHSTETILWIRKGLKSKHTFNYKLMKELNGGKQMKDVWIVGRPVKNEYIFGKHPTQKPERLIEMMVLSSTNEGDTVLDLFMGSGTTGVVSLRNGRNFIGVEKETEYFNISSNRLKFVMNEPI
jgi:site-specific DNA-methyltransferase (adenine-specific)